MKQQFLLLAISFLSLGLFSQDEEAPIRAALADYMEGTSYNRISQIDNAFYEGAELFLDDKEMNLNVVPVEEYMGYFRDRTEGEFNGRVGKILSIESFGNIAMAKAEILIPEWNKRFIDMFILKEIEGQWQIISKTATSEQSHKTGERILFVVSNATTYGDTDIPNGNSFSEIVIIYDVLDAAGYTIDFVSPEGGIVPIAYFDVDPALYEKYMYDNDLSYALGHTLSPDQVDASMYEAIYFVGGSSAMFGVPEDTGIQRVAMQIYEDQEGVLASVCHGTAGIVHLKKRDGSYLVDGETITGFPEKYERQDAAYFKTFPFLIQETIESHGGTFVSGERLDDLVAGEGRLITGQTNLSCEEVARRMVERLKEER